MLRGARSPGHTPPPGGLLSAGLKNTTSPHAEYGLDHRCRACGSQFEVSRHKAHLRVLAPTPDVRRAPCGAFQPNGLRATLRGARSGTTTPIVCRRAASSPVSNCAVRAAARVLDRVRKPTTVFARSTEAEVISLGPVPRLLPTNTQFLSTPPLNSGRLPVSDSPNGCPVPSTRSRITAPPPRAAQQPVTGGRPPPPFRILRKATPPSQPQGRGLPTNSAAFQPPSTSTPGPRGRRRGADQLPGLVAGRTSATTAAYDPDGPWAQRRHVPGQPTSPGGAGAGRQRLRPAP